MLKEPFSTTSMMMKAKRATNINDFQFLCSYVSAALLLLPVYIHHGLGHIKNMCFTLKHHPRTGFVLMEILNILMRLHKGAVCACLLCTRCSYVFLSFDVVSVLVFSLFREDKWIFFLMFSMLVLLFLRKIKRKTKQKTSVERTDPSG
jgi:hypothetical protein